MKWFYRDNILIRKEYFGTLVFLLNGARYKVDNRYFDILKSLKSYNTLPELKMVAPNIKEAELITFLDSFCKKNVLTHNPHNPTNIRIIENEPISKDCLSFPRVVYWECTRRCNYQCIHCYSLSGPNRVKKETSFGVIKKLIDEMREKGTEFFSIGGGEPLMYPHLYDVIRCSIKEGLAVELTTNGSLLNGERIQRLKETGLNFIQVSLDGATEEIYLKIRRGGNFNKVVENISKLTKEDFVVSICTVITQLNLKDIDSLIDLSKKLGARYFRVILLQEIGRAEKLHKLQPTKKELRAIYMRLLEKKEKEKNNIQIQFNANLLYPTTKNISWMPENHYGCPAGRSLCGIDAYGNVYPCSYLLSDGLICGNIKEKSLFEIWRDSLIMNEIRNIEKLEGKCANCEFLNLCRGGCRASAYLKTGKINDGDPLCVVS